MNRNRLLFVSLSVLVLLLVSASGVPAGASQEKGPLNLALIWHQHQPLYRDAETEVYKLPWVRVHAVQEYYDSPAITNEFPEINVTYNLVPSLIEQIKDYARIDARESEKGGVYEFIGAADTHLKLALTPPEELSGAEKETIAEEFFWLNGYMLDDDADDPYYSERYVELKEIASRRTLMNEEVTDLTALFFLWQISPELHEDYGLAQLRGQESYDRTDVIKIIEAQQEICADLLNQYREARDEGSEIITSPYYHPILPLLMSDGWEGVEKDVWREDTLSQLESGRKVYREFFGEDPDGLWPPEQAVSQDMVGPVVETGFRWFVSDEGVLGDSLGKTPGIDELTEPYRVKSNSGSAFVFFRQSELSNKISLSYGNKPTSQAVGDFMSQLRGIYSQLEDPAEKLLTVAMDGENWMFMAGYPNNGRSFLRELYERLAEADWVNTTTPGEFVSSHRQAATDISELATGSWAGDLSTWRGEPEEDQGWNRLIKARRKAHETAVNEKAREAISAAEGSDWFWWYGTDKDSGNDEVFDALFKTHMINAYSNSGVKREEVPRELFVEKAPPASRSLGEVKPTLDGRVSSENEWSNAASFAAGETEYFDRFALGYGANDLYVQVDTSKKAKNLIGEDLSFNIYFSGRSDANATTRYGKEQLGFGLSQIVSLHMEDVEEDGTWNVFRYESDGEGDWKFASSIANLSRRKAKVDAIIEFKIPFETLNIEPEENFTFRMTLEKRKAGDQLATAPGKPVLTKIPKPISGEKIFGTTDPQGDDYGPGSYTYPKSPLFEHEGLFDLQKYEIYDSGEKWIFAFDFGAMTNPWSAPLGFSHQLINLYLDTEKGGQTETYKKGARVRFDPESPWDYFIKIAGWPGYGRKFVTAGGQERKIEVTSNLEKKKVIAAVPKNLLPEVSGNHYLMVMSQDGYGKDHVRAILEKATKWQGGGSKTPSVAANVYDYLAPSNQQKEILSSYDRAKEQYPVLQPFPVDLND